MTALILFACSALPRQTACVDISGAGEAVVVLSGGLDSVTLAYQLQAQGWRLHFVSFNYGQRHRKELDCAQICAARLAATIDVVDLSSLAPLLRGSALTDDIAVPHGHYAAPSMSVTIVPNRNAVFLSIAYAVAVARGAQRVAIGIHAGDHHIYPDCRPAFAQAFADMQRIAIEGCGDGGLHLHCPFLLLSKAAIVATGAALKVPFEDTWSCYEGGDLHCGHCGTCVERKEAFALAGVADLTRYCLP